MLFQDLLLLQLLVPQLFHETLGAPDVQPNQTCPSRNFVESASIGSSAQGCKVKIAFVPQEIFAYPVLDSKLESVSVESFEEERDLYAKYRETYPTGFAFDETLSSGCRKAELPCPYLGVDMQLISKMFQDFFPDWQFSLVVYHSFPAALYAARIGDVDFTWCAAAVTSAREACTACPETADAFAARSENACCLDFSAPYFEGGLAIVSKVETKGGFVDALLSHRMLNVCMLFFGMLFIAGHIMWALESRTELGSVYFPRSYFPGVFQGIYWSCTTATTVGYGDTGPTTDIGKIFTMGWMFVGIVFSGILIGLISSAMTVQNLANLEIRSLNQLEGQKVCFVPGYYEEYLAKEGSSVIGRKASTITECIEQLEAESVDAILYDKPVLERYVYQGRIGSGFAVSNSLMDVGYGVAFPEGSDLTHRMNAGILALLADELFMKKVKQMWLSDEAPPEEVNVEINWYFLILTCSLLGWLLTMKIIEQILNCRQRNPGTNQGMVEKNITRRLVIPDGTETMVMSPAHNYMEKVLRESLAGVRTELSELHENLDRTDDLLKQVVKTAEMASDVQTCVVQQAKALAGMQSQVGELTCRMRGVSPNRLSSSIFPCDPHFAEVCQQSVRRGGANYRARSSPVCSRGSPVKSTPRSLGSA